jgi:hypothetical protein
MKQEHYKKGDVVYYDDLINIRRIYGVVIEATSREFKVFWFFHKRAYSYLYLLDDFKGTLRRIIVLE